MIEIIAVVTGLLLACLGRMKIRQSTVPDARQHKLVALKEELAKEMDRPVADLTYRRSLRHRIEELEE